jgi:hypothetical protein
VDGDCLRSPLFFAVGFADLQLEGIYSYSQTGSSWELKRDMRRDPSRITRSGDRGKMTMAGGPPAKGQLHQSQPAIARSPA